MEKAAEERDAKLQKQATLMKKYSYFADNAESFPSDQRTLEIPTNMDRFDRISVMAQMQDILARENTALQSARIYRDRCTDLKKRIRKLEEEKEEIRFFWRNKVLEGNSRGGKWLCWQLTVESSDNNTKLPIIIIINKFYYYAS